MTAPAAFRLWRLPTGDREQAHDALADVLAAETGADPGAVRLGRAPCVHCGEPHGKPFVTAPAGHDVRFSIAHTAGLSLIAIARGRELGVDVETVRPVRGAQAIADSRFTAAEADHLRALPDAERDTAFLRLWTRKEAYLKATGQGWAGGLDSFDALRGPEPGWELHDVDAGPGHMAALALAPPGYIPGG